MNFAFFFFVSSQVVNVRWKPPLIGRVDGYKLKVIPKFVSDNSVRNIHMESTASPFTLRDLVPGGKYELNLYSVYDDKESVTFVSKNFTTSKRRCKLYSNIINSFNIATHRPFDSNCEDM